MLCDNSWDVSELLKYESQNTKCCCLLKVDDSPTVAYFSC
jgi:hypothetical protein